jgi:hypothetical protein
MKHFNEARAFEIIKAALEADAIRLAGNNSADADAAERRARGDARYLVTLYSDLIGQKQKSSE